MKNVKLLSEKIKIESKTKRYRYKNLLKPLGRDNFLIRQNT